MDPVLRRLVAFAIEPFETEPFVRAIEALRKEAWTDDRIFRYLKNHEEIQPSLSEDAALANMRRIRAE